MEKIKFLKNEKIYDVTLSFVKDGVIKIVCTSLPSEKKYLSGFELLNEHNLSVMEDFSLYTTKYKDSDEDNVIYLSTGEVYVEPTILEPEPAKELTDEEKAEIERQNKISSISIDISNKKKEIADLDYIFTKRQEIEEIEDANLKAQQLEKYKADYPNLQEIILKRISLRTEINDLESELATL